MIFVLDTESEMLGVNLYERCLDALYSECGEYKSKLLNNALVGQFQSFLEHYIGKNMPSLCREYTTWQKNEMERSNPGEMIAICESEDFLRKFVIGGKNDKDSMCKL